MDKPHSSRSWLAPPSIPSDLYSLFFVPPHLTLFSFLASLQLSVPPLCPCTGKTPQFSKHICCCQAPLRLFSPTQASYSSSVFWLPSSSHCQLSFFRVFALSTPPRLQLTKPTNYHLLAKSQSVMPVLGLDLFSYSLQLTPLSPSIHYFLYSSWQLQLLRRMAGVYYL